MVGMSMPRQQWYLELSGYLWMWMAMMVPMMLPSLVPMVSRFRRSGPAGQWLPGAAAVTLLLAGIAQLTTWKARQLALCRGEPSDDCHLGATGSSAFRHGLELGLGCSRSCGPLMLAL